MAIDNNILLINGTAIRPVPQFSIDYETFKSGEYIIGGVILIRLEGQIFGTSLNDLRTKVQTISSYSSKCQTIKISCGSRNANEGPAERNRPTIGASVFGNASGSSAITAVENCERYLLCPYDNDVPNTATPTNTSSPTTAALTQSSTTTATLPYPYT